MSRAFRGIAACTSHHFPSSVLSYLNSPQGRADYLHAIADLLGRPAHGTVPRGPGVVGLDIGTGPLCVYPLIGHAEYGWSFLATDVDAKSMECAEKLLKSNEGVPIRLRLQPDRQSVLRNVLTPRPGSASATDASDQRDPEVFAFTMCNPPFYSSEAEAASAAARKWRGLARVSKGDGRGAATSTERRGGLRSFGGSASELWAPGGEKAFVTAHIHESAENCKAALWFTSLVSAERSMPKLRAELRASGALAVEELPMATGNKAMRVLAWSFHSDLERAEKILTLLQ